MRLKIREAVADDAEILSNIARQAKAYWGYPEELTELWRAELLVHPEFIERHIVYCAELKAEVVGFYALTGSDVVRELDHMWVLPAHMGQKVGQRLFEHARETATGKGVKKIQIVADPNAAGFYTKMGAEQIGFLESQPPGRMLPLLELKLSRSSKA